MVLHSTYAEMDYAKSLGQRIRERYLILEEELKNEVLCVNHSENKLVIVVLTCSFPCFISRYLTTSPISLKRLRCRVPFNKTIRIEFNSQF